MGTFYSTVTILKIIVVYCEHETCISVVFNNSLRNIVHSDVLIENPYKKKKKKNVKGYVTRKHDSDSNYYPCLWTINVDTVVVRRIGNN